MGEIKENSEQKHTLSHPTRILLIFLLGIYPLFLCTEVLAETISESIGSVCDINTEIGDGFPWINFGEGQAFTENTASMAIDAQLQPLSLASGRFDDDGTPDLALGYESLNGGRIVIYKGNPDAIYPNTIAAKERKASSTFTNSPFLSPIIDLEVPGAPVFMVSGDFNGDRHLDLIFASEGKKTLYALFGDVNGTLEDIEEIPLPGVATAMIAGEFYNPVDFDRLVLAVSGPDGSKILFFDERSLSFLTEPRYLELAHEVEDLAWGRMDDDGSADLLVAAGNELVIVSGRELFQLDGTEPGEELDEAAVTSISLAFRPIALAVGDFITDDNAKPELAALSMDGKIHIFKGFDEMAKGFRERITLSALDSDISSGKRPGLLTANISTHPSDDLLLIDPQDGNMSVMFGETREEDDYGDAFPQPFSIASLGIHDQPVAVLPMRLNSDALQDLVILHGDGEMGASLLMSEPVHIFTVNSTGNQHDCKGGDGVCNIKIGEDPQGNPICGGGCTLIAAVTEAGSSPGADKIAFNIPGTGPHTIEPLKVGSTVVPLSLPIVDSVTIDGTTEPDHADKPMIETGYYGFLIAADNCTVRGLVINRCTGIEIQSNYNLIEGNFIGTDVTGTVARPNECYGVVINRGNRNAIGGVELSARNIISGNDCGGIKVYKSQESTVIAKNFIGTDITGKKGFTYSGTGVDIVDSQNVLVGGKTEKWGNLISGNSYGVVVLSDMSTSGNTLIWYNAIGSDADGNALIGNALDGIVCQRVEENVSMFGNLIGGSGWVGTGPGGSTGFRNGIRISRSKDVNIYANGIGIKYDGTGILRNAESAVRIDESSGIKVQLNTIAGNGTGVWISGNYGPAENNEVSGNAIGWNKTGKSCFGNAGDGILITGSGARNNKIFANLVSGSGKVEGGKQGYMNGIHIVKSNNNTIRSNVIGRSTTGTTSCPNKECGIKIENASDNLIGGSTTKDGNTISDNRTGVHIVSTGSVTQYNTLSANRIGTNEKSDEIIGNKRDGVVIEGINAKNNAVMNNVIGGNGTDASNAGQQNGIRIENGSDNKIKGNFIGTNSEGDVRLANKGHGIRVTNSNGNKIIGIGYLQGNLIAFNGEDGVYIESGNKNYIRGNSIYDNGGLGIDLGVNGVRASQSQRANNMVQWPALTSASPYTGKTAIIGDVIDSPNTTYHIDFYSNKTCDPSGHGEGRTHLGSAERTTDANGDKHFALTFDTVVPTGQFITATSTDPGGNTSEFSNCVEVSEGRGDRDSDGIADIIEAFAPNEGDGNGDGVTDDEQSNVASFQLIDDKGYATYAVSGECTALAISYPLEEASLENDALFDYPFGVAGFSIPCETADLVVIYHEQKDLGNYIYRQYGPTGPDDSEGDAWYSLPDSVDTEENRVIVRLKDNAPGDDTGDDGLIQGKGGMGLLTRPMHR